MSQEGPRTTTVVKQGVVPNTSTGQAGRVKGSNHVRSYVHHSLQFVQLQTSIAKAWQQHIFLTYATARCGTQDRQRKTDCPAETSSPKARPLKAQKLHGNHIRAASAACVHSKYGCSVMICEKAKTQTTLHLLQLQLRPARGSPPQLLHETWHDCQLELLKGQKDVGMYQEVRQTGSVPRST